MTYVECLDLATCFVVLICLCVRRATWRYKWEQPKTIGLTLIAVGALLKAPPISWLMDRDVLHGLYLLVAHVLIASGIASFAYSAERKLRSDKDFRKWHVKFVIFPWCLGVSTMVGLFAAGAWVTIEHPLGLSTYTMSYWLVYDLLTVYFLLLWAYALGYLFYDPPSRRAVAVYLFAVGVSLVGATCRALLVTVDVRVSDPLLMNIANTANSVAIMVFAVGAAHMWRRRRRIGITRKDGSSQPVVRKIT